MLNWNKVAKRIAEEEMGKEEVNIAQIKEVLGVFAEICYTEYDDWEILKALTELAQRRLDVEEL